MDTIQLAQLAHCVPITALFALAQAHVPHAIQATYQTYVTFAILQITISKAQDQLSAAHAPMHSVTVLLVP